MKVSWDESVCIHAGKCVQGAPEVFKVEDGKFVIDTSASTEDKITDVGFRVSIWGFKDRIII